MQQPFPTGYRLLHRLRAEAPSWMFSMLVTRMVPKLEHPTLLSHRDGRRLPF